MLTSDIKGWSIALRIILFFVFSLGVAACIYIITTGELSGRESAMLGILVTILSVLASWLISNMFANNQFRTAIQDVRDEHTRNLRTYALKAAEKVNNLSKELGRLAAYLEQELQESSYTSAEEELNAKEERIESAIHLVNTLKSVNDTALSDWQGVIGDEINEQREKAGQREETLRAVVERLAALEAEQAEETPLPSTETSELKSELDSLRRDVRALAGELGAPLLGTRHIHTASRNRVEASCPHCNNPLSFKQKPRNGSYKAITCEKCGSDLISEYTEEFGFTIKLRRDAAETISCPSCDTQSVVALDEWPTASTNLVCPHCDASVRVSRHLGAIRVTVAPDPKHRVTDEIIAAVRAALPAQPWPKGIHKLVAERLGMTPKLVQKAIQQLIMSGVFQDQVDGQIVTTEEKLRIIRQTGSRL
ncbi:MAG: hypothetical protein ACLP0B_21465 [Steroidobacteraceae bacterium]|jgi:transcription elongation factor Elf1